MLKTRVLLLFILGSFVEVKSEPCFTENKACKLDSFNLLEVFENVNEISECKKLCEDTSECQYFAFHYDELIPSHYHKCYLFRHCNTMIDFPKSLIGFTGLCTCSLNVEPQDGQLIKELYAETEIQCKQACQVDADCEIYNFLEPAADCELLRGVSSYSTSPLPGFHTGPGDCTSEDDFCTFALLDKNSHVMLVESDAITVKSGMMDCKVNISLVLMGQGGLNRKKGGAGSGFVNNMFAILDPSIVLNVDFVSDTDGNVTVHANGEMLLQAMNGEHGGEYKGGDGYSGGGYYSDGGMDGGIGNCTSADTDRCGKGQGIDIQKFSSLHFTLTPGSGGKSNPDRGGGGGGGVLVNGLGPHGDHEPSYGMGEGYSNEYGRGFALFDIVR